MAKIEKSKNMQDNTMIVECVNGVFLKRRLKRDFTSYESDTGDLPISYRIEKVFSLFKPQVSCRFTSSKHKIQNILLFYLVFNFVLFFIVFEETIEEE